MRRASYILGIILLVAGAVANAHQTLGITLLSSPQTIAQIMRLQRNMPLSKNPKQLSTHPTVTCFPANIDKFLPTNLSKQKFIYGCIFSDQVAMNAALLRAGLFVHTDAGMASDEQLFNSKLMTTVGGHDFSGDQLQRYHSKISISPETKAEHATYKRIENEFNTSVLDPIINKYGANFIFFGVINTKKFRQNLSHELLHAQYYNNAQIARVLQKVWDNAPKKDQDIIVQCLRDGGYDMHQHELLLREFYSYFLQFDAAKYLKGIKVLQPMSPLAKLYAAKIRKALAAEHITVLTLE